MNYSLFTGRAGEILNKIMQANHAMLQSGQGLVNAIADNIVAELVSEARTANPAWAARYLSTIRQTPAGNGSGAEIYHDKTDPNAMFFNMVENGVKSWSIKDALLNGKAARRNLSKTGKIYVNVPFRHRTPATNVASSQFSSVMPGSVYQAARAGLAIRGAGFLSGLKRFDNSGGGHGQYFAFRRVTPKSQGWQFPGKAATPVFQVVERKVEKIITEYVEAFIESYLSEIQGVAGA